MARAARLLVALLAVALTAPAASATSCHVLTDPAYDETLALVVPADHAALDVVSADVATDAARIAAAVRVRSLAGAAPTAVDGHDYVVEFTAGGTEFAFWFYVRASGTSFTLNQVVRAGGTSYPPIATVTGTVDVANAEIRASAPLSLLAPAAVAAGDSIVFSVRAYREIEPGAATLLDSAGPATYQAGTPSCLATS